MKANDMEVAPWKKHQAANTTATRRKKLWGVCN